MKTVSAPAVTVDAHTGLAQLTDEQLADITEHGYSEEVLPLQPAEREWTTWNYFTVWMGAVFNILSYMTVAGFFVLGLSVPQVIAAVMLSAVIVSAGYVINGHAAAKYGLPFAMLLRDSFGVKGSIFPALARGLIAGVVFFGTTTIVGAQAFNVMFERIFPGYEDLGGDFDLLGLDVPTMISYAVLWVITVLLYLGGMKVLAVFGKWASPAVFVMIMGAAIWAIDTAGGFGKILDYAPEGPGATPLAFITCVSALVSNWAGPIVNTADLTRNAKNTKAPAIGFPLGLLVSYVLFAITAVAFVAGIKIAFGEDVFNPVDAFKHIDNTPAVILLILALNTGATAFCVFGNLLPSGLQMTALLPKVFNVKTAGVLTAVLGTLIMPWKLVEDPDTLFYFYSFIGSMFGPIAGIMITSYYLERRRQLDLDEIYVAPGDDGAYPGGYNKVAVVILIISFVFTMSGAFLKDVEFLARVNSMAFFAGLILSSVLYAVVTRVRRAPRREPQGGT